MAKLIQEDGMQINNERFKLVKKSGAQGEEIPKHNHPKHSILFTVVSGHVEVTLNETDHYNLQAGQLLSFDGEDFISAKFIQNSQVFITLIAK